MIILINLNRFLGGGEVLLIRFAKYLKSKNIDYSIISFDVDCYIGNEAKKSGLNLIPWPINEDSVSYMNQKDREALLQTMRKEFHNVDKVYPFSFCFRDLYNSLYIFSRINCSEVRFSTGIYHQEDVFYLTSLSFNKKKILKYNRTLAYDIAEKNGIIFASEASRKTSLNDSYSDLGEIIPIPIDLPKQIPLKQLNNDTQIKIICISRFVEFKIAAVLAIVRYIRRKPNYQLDLIGYGHFELLLRIYIRFHRMRNVTIHGKIEHEKLNEIIDQASVGYAQGTSILEIAKRGLPVVIAPYSRVVDIFNKNFKCMGIFGECNNLNFGDIRDNGSKDFVSLFQTIETVIQDYDHFCILTIEHVKRFSSELIFNHSTNIILNSQYQKPVQAFEPLRGTWIKYFIRKFLKK